MHLNRAIRARDLDMIYVMGPGHGGPAAVASAWLDGTYSETYHHIGQDEEGMRARRRWPSRRFGFHGLSHAWASRRAAELCGRAAPDAVAGFRVVTCHLGAGASVAAVAGGRCVDTTMGFTPLEGLVMATRSGSIDPGLLVWLLEQGGFSVRELADGLEHPLAWPVSPALPTCDR